MKGRMTLRGLFWPLPVIELSLPFQNGGQFGNYMQKSICVPNFMLVTKSEQFSHTSAPLLRTQSFLCKNKGEDALAQDCLMF